MLVSSGRFDLHDPAAEALPVGKPDMGAHVDAARQCVADRAVHDGGVAGMEAAGDVGGGQQAEQRAVVAHLPGAKALAEIGVQVDLRHCSPPSAKRTSAVP